MTHTPLQPIVDQSGYLTPSLSLSLSHSLPFHFSSFHPSLFRDHLDTVKAVLFGTQFKNTSMYHLLTMVPLKILPLHVGTFISSVTPKPVSPSKEIISVENDMKFTGSRTLCVPAELKVLFHGCGKFLKKWPKNQ